MYSTILRKWFGTFKLYKYSVSLLIENVASCCTVCQNYTRVQYFLTKFTTYNRELAKHVFNQKWVNGLYETNTAQIHDDCMKISIVYGWNSTLGRYRRLSQRVEDYFNKYSWRWIDELTLQSAINYVHKSFTRIENYEE